MDETIKTYHILVEQLPEKKTEKILEILGNFGLGFSLLNAFAPEKITYHTTKAVACEIAAELRNNDLPSPMKSE